MEKKEKNVFCEKTNTEKHLLKTDGMKRRVKYNDDMLDETEAIKKGIGARVTELRLSHDVSAREMSLFMGHGAGYINSIENCTIMPSVLTLFEICEFFNISMGEFFSYTTKKRESGINGAIPELLEKLEPKESEVIMSLIALLAGEI